MSTNLEYTERERQRKRVGSRPTNLNEKKGNRDLEREIRKNSKRDIYFVGRT